MNKFFGLILGFLGYSIVKNNNANASIPEVIENAVLNEIPEIPNTINSFFGNPDLPRGIRNNNAGNLVQTNINWQGKIDLFNNTDSRFEQFESPEYGLRAMMKDLLNDWRKGTGTVRSLIEEYAPSFENNTQAYINSVTDRLGVNENERLDLQNENTLINLSKAIVIHENGAGGENGAWYSDETYKRAVELI